MLYILCQCYVFLILRELDSFAGDEEMAMDEYERRKDILKSGGTLVLRAFGSPSSLAHFQPVQPRKWKLIHWRDNCKPVAGRWGVAPDVKAENEVEVNLLISKYFNIE